MFQEKVKKLPGFKPPRANHCIKMDESKVVDTLDIEDMGDKVWFEILSRKTNQYLRKSEFF